jgi:hypothetical protein
MGVIVFGSLEGLVALLVSSKPWRLDVGCGVPCCPLVICSAVVIIICELINYINQKLLTCILLAKKRGTLDAMRVIQVTYSLYDEILHITVPEYSETNVFLNHMFNVD